VEDLYVDREARQPRFAVVSAGGFLGVGKKHFVIPVEEVSRDVSEAEPEQAQLDALKADLERDQVPEFARIRLL
jgi:hypothetical protein